MTRTRFRMVLTLVAAALVACSDGRRTSGAVPTSIGPDAILLRVPTRGGLVSAYRAGSDSALWTSRARAPGISAILGFDEFLGMLILQANNGRIEGADVRLGTLARLGNEQDTVAVTLNDAAIAEGSAVYALDDGRRIVRLTPTGTWNRAVDGGASQLFPIPDGALIVLGARDGQTTLRRFVPPETDVVDSATIPAVRLAVRTPIGDRLWTVNRDGLLAILTRDLTPATRLALRDSVVALAPTPSGDRVFVATSANVLRVIDRYAEKETGVIDLPGPATDLRMDPDGHYLLARAASGDSAYVVSIGTERVVNTVATPWRADLPLVTPEGQIFLVKGRDAVLVDAESNRERGRYANGSADTWMLVRWNGFRPRAAGLDRPVEFEDFQADSAAADSALAALVASRYGNLTNVPRTGNPPGTPTTPEPAQGQLPPEPAPPRNPTVGSIWTVSFATLLDENRARKLADSIVVNGRRARMVHGVRDGVPVYRVLLGPFDTRQDAERAGMASRLSYWVFEGAP